MIEIFNSNLFNNSNDNFFSIFNEKKVNKSSNKSKTKFLYFELNDSTQNSILKYIPHTFSLTTNNSSGKFNIDLLKRTSPIIRQFIIENPRKFSYHLQINDEQNVIGKFERMYQGEKVIFDISDIPISIQITKILKIECCPNYLREQISKYESILDRYLKYGVRVDSEMICNYFKNFKNFTIKTKSKKYKCSSFGVYFSGVIRNLLIKNPTINTFEYDIDDEFNEFESIISLFNFEKIELTKDNVYFLKETAENLQISSIQEKINKKIAEFEEITETIDKQQNLCNSIEELFGWLFNIEKIKTEKVKELIVESFWSKEEDNVRELAAFIIHVIKTSFSLQSKIIDLLILLQKESHEKNCLNILIPFVIEKMKQYFGYKTHICSFVYKLHKIGLISKEELRNLLQNQYTKADDLLNIKNDLNLILWFLPELIEIGIIDNSEILALNKRIAKNSNIGIKPEKWIKFIKYYYPKRIDQYKKMRDENEPDDDLTKSIIRDDVDTLQSIVTKMKIDYIKTNVPINIFTENKMPIVEFSYINFAANCGSIKCFKYLLLNHAEVDQKTFSCAVNGGIIEIIKIVDQQNSKNQKNRKMNRYENKAIIYSIKKHQNDVFDWIFEQKYSQKNDFNSKIITNLLIKSAKYGNAHSFIEIVNKGFNFSSCISLIINNAVKNGFYRFFQMIFNLNSQKDIKDDISLDKYGIVLFGNLSIFKLSLKYLYSSNSLKHSLLFAVKNNYRSIIEYYFSDLIMKKFKITQNGIYDVLINSISPNSSELFNYLFDGFLKICPSLFINFQKLVYAISEACFCKNINVVKKLTEFHLKNYPDEKFNDQFLNAVTSGSTDICRYFIDKKVKLDFEELLQFPSSFVSINTDIISLLIENSTPEFKYLFFRTLLDTAIVNNNVNLVDYLLKNGSPIENGLILAVESNNIEIVDIILKYNCSSSLINRKTNNGTVLHIAINENNIEMVKRILKIPEIDPSLYDEKGRTALSLAIYQRNIEIINAILDFYGESISSHKRMVYEAEKMALKLIFENQKAGTDQKITKTTENLIPIVKMIMKIKGFDPNVSRKKCTFLLFACETNEIEIVKSLLKYDNICINIHSSDSGNTPLISAIYNNNVEIACLLINDERININSINYKQETALTIAVERKLPEIVNLLVNNKKFDPVESRLDFAFFISSGQIASKLHSLKSLDVNYLKINQEKCESTYYSQNKIIYETVLTTAVSKKDYDKIELIISHPSFDAVKSQLKKAIVICIESDEVKAFNKLIKVPNIDINFSINLQSALSIAVELKAIKIIKVILKIPSFNSSKSDLLGAFLKGITMINTFTNTRTSIKYIDKKNKDPMLDILNELIEFDKKHNNLIDLNKLLPNGKSFFTMEKDIYNKDYVNFLLKNGADPNKPDKFGIFPLEYAIATGNEEFVRALIESGKIDLYAKTPKKKIKFEDRFQYDNDFSPTEKNETYLHLAAKSENINVFKIFLDIKIYDINVTDDKGETPLIKACRFGIKNNVSLLFKFDDLDYLHCNNDGDDALKILQDYSISEKNDKPTNKDEYLACLLEIIDFDNDTIMNDRTKNKNIDNSNYWGTYSPAYLDDDDFE